MLSEPVAAAMLSAWPRETKTNTVLPRKCTSHSKHPLPTKQEKTLHMDITRSSKPKSVIILFAAKDGEDVYSQKEQDQELTVARIMNSLLQTSDSN